MFGYQAKEWFIFARKKKNRIKKNIRIFGTSVTFKDRKGAESRTKTKHQAANQSAWVKGLKVGGCRKVHLELH